MRIMRSLERTSLTLQLSLLLVVASCPGCIVVDPGPHRGPAGEIPDEYASVPPAGIQPPIVSEHPSLVSPQNGNLAGGIESVPQEVPPKSDPASSMANDFPSQIDYFTDPNSRTMFDSGSTTDCHAYSATNQSRRVGLVKLPWTLLGRAHALKSRLHACHPVTDVHSQASMEPVEPTPPRPKFHPVPTRPVFRPRADQPIPRPIKQPFYFSPVTNPTVGEDAS